MTIRTFMSTESIRPLNNTELDTVSGAFMGGQINAAIANINANSGTGISAQYDAHDKLGNFEVQDLMSPYN